MQCMTENRGLFMEIREESRLSFEFPEDTKVIKFDETDFYRSSFNAFSNSKGMDFITVSKDNISFIEVKNCLGDEGNCRWRIFPNNQKKETSRTDLDVEERDSLDIEVPQKLVMTLGALTGARSYQGRKESVQEFEEIQKYLLSDKFNNAEKKNYVILFLEGDFGGHTRTKKMIMSDLQRSMEGKMRWLNCRVSVVDSDTYNRKVIQNVKSI